MTRHPSILRLLPLLLGAAAACGASGFTEEQLIAAARVAVAETAPQAPAMRAVAERSERLRALLAVAQDRVATELPAEERRTLTIAFGPPTQDRDVVIGWLMRGGHLAVAAPELSGIYNPFVDGWLLLRWQPVGGSPRLTQVALVTGRLLRGGAAAPEPAGEMPFSQALVARRLRALTGFSRVLEDPGVAGFFLLYPQLQVSETEAVIAAARREVGALAQWSRTNPQSLALIHRAIDQGDDPALHSIPSRLRRDLGPIALAATPRGTEVVLQSAAYPTRCLFASFAGPGDAPQLFALDLDPPLIGSADR